MSANAPADPYTLPNGVVLRDHQRRVVDHMLSLAKTRTPPRLKGLIVAHAMGSGKTYTAAAVARALLAAGHVDHAYVVAPNTVQGYWTTCAARTRVPLTVGTHTQGLFVASHLLPSLRAAGKRTLLIVDEAHNMRTPLDNPNKRKRATTAAPAPARPPSSTKKPPRAEAMLTACEAATYVLLMSGTPVVNHIEELRNLLCALTGVKTYAGAKAAFKEISSDYTLSRPDLGDMLSWPMTARIRGAFSVHTGAAAQEPLPSGGSPFPRVETRIERLIMSPAYLTWYERIEQAAEAMFPDGDGSKNTAFINGIRRAVNGRIEEQRTAWGPKMELLEALMREWGHGEPPSPLPPLPPPTPPTPLRTAVSTAVSAFVSRWWKQGSSRAAAPEPPASPPPEQPAAENAEAAAVAPRPPPQKVILYSAWLDFGVEAVEDLLDRMGVSYAKVTGGMSAAKREAAMQRYNDDADPVNVLLFTKAGAEGMDLKATRRVVILEPHWHAGLIDQAIARAVRMTSHAHLPPEERVVTVHHLVLDKPPLPPGVNDHDRKESADRMLREIAAEKTKWIESAFIPFARHCSIEEAAPPPPPLVVDLTGEDAS